MLSQIKHSLPILIAALAFIYAPVSSDATTEQKPRIIEFTASWCKFCKELQPTMKKLEKKYGDRVEIIEVDISDPANRELMKEYRVNTLPTLVFEKSKGNFYETFGYNPDEDLDREAKALLR